MPPGGFRLAIVNCSDLDVGFEVRYRLASRFRSVGRMRVPRGDRTKRATQRGRTKRVAQKRPTNRAAQG